MSFQNNPLQYDEFTSNTLKWFKTAIKLFTYFIKWNLEDLYLCIKIYTIVINDKHDQIGCLDLRERA